MKIDFAELAGKLQLIADKVFEQAVIFQKFSFLTGNKFEQHDATDFLCHKLPIEQLNSTMQDCAILLSALVGKGNEKVVENELCDLLKLLLTNDIKHNWQVVKITTPSEPFVLIDIFATTSKEPQIVMLGQNETASLVEAMNHDSGWLNHYNLDLSFNKDCISQHKDETKVSAYENLRDLFIKLDRLSYLWQPVKPASKLLLKQIVDLNDNQTKIAADKLDLCFKHTADQIRDDYILEQYQFPNTMNHPTCIKTITLDDILRNEVDHGNGTIVPYEQFPAEDLTPVLKYLGQQLS